MPRPQFQEYDPSKKKPAALAPFREPEERKSGAIDADKLNKDGREPRTYQSHGYTWI